MTISRPALALMISLAFNFIFVGLFAGMQLARGGPASDTLRTRTERPAPVSRADRQIVRNLLEANRTSTDPLRQAHHEARRRVYQILTAPDFDPVAAETAFADLRTTELAMRTALQDNLMEHMPDLSVEQRRQIAGRLLSTRSDNRRRRDGFKRGHSN